MKATLNNTCSQVVLTSAYILPTNLYTKLTIKRDDTTVHEQEYSSPTNVTVALDFDDGVYDVFLTAVLQDGSLVEERGCIVSLCTTYCEKLTNADDEQLLSLLALSLANDCPVCSCDHLKDLFKETEHVPSGPCKCCPMPTCTSCH